MKLHIHSQKASTLAWGAVLAAGLFSVSARADEWNKRTVLTVSEPIQVTDTVLQPGKYVLRLIPNGSSGVDRHVVQIFNGDETHIINTVLTVPTVRPRPTGTTQFTYWETPPGTARALRDWYYPGENTGDEFPYPNQPTQVATWVPPPTGNASASAETTTTTTTTTPAEPVPAEPAAAEPPQPQPEQAAPTAPPAEQAAPAPPDNSADRAAPAELPKTGSPYPLIGLCGLVFAGLGGALLVKRTA
jgi:LPXTG-motif cell wall-anchored protein